MMIFGKLQKGLETIIKIWANQIKVRKPPLAVDLDFMNEVLDGK